MPYKCSVPLCRGNYDASNKCHMFSFPQKEDLKNAWIRAIPRKDFEVTKNSKVCHKHFHSSDIEWTREVFDARTGENVIINLQRPKLRKNAIPTIFPDCPSYLTREEIPRRDSPDSKRARKEKLDELQAIAESLKCKAAFDASRSFHSLSELKDCIKRHKPSSNWDVVEKDDFVLFLNSSISEGKFSLNFTVIIDKNLSLTLFYRENNLFSLGPYNFPMSVNSTIDVFNVLDFVETNVSLKTDQDLLVNIIISLLKILKTKVSEAKIINVNFIIHQLNLIISKPEKYRYSSEIMIFASIVQLISPAAYRFMRNSGDIILPHPSTINKICGKFNTNPLNDDSEDFLSYAKQRVESLKPDDLFVSLMLDEVYLKQCYDYKGGNIVGHDYDALDLANSAHTFMLQSLFSKYRDVVYILPVKKITAENLFEYLLKIILKLESFGFQIVVIVTDNNSINRKCISLLNSNNTSNFVYPHPCNRQRPLFYCVDPVHLLKSGRNNWINQKNNQQALYFPSFNLSEPEKVYTASFLDLKKLYEIESGDLLKHGYSLTQKALWPSNLEKQNVKLALQVINEHVSAALKEKGESHQILNYEGTAMFIEIMSTWFKILNVKSPTKGIHKRDEMCEPLFFKEGDKKLIFLDNFVSWLKKWENFKSDTGHLTKETLSAFLLTTNCIIELTRYVTSELGMAYLLPGKIQTDELENRFSLYRRMAGTNYHITLRQLYEIENKLRVSNVCKLSLLSKSKGEINVIEISDDDDCTDDPLCACLNNERSIFSISVTNSDINKLGDKLPLLAFLSGYCVHSVTSNKLKCDDCKSNLTVDRSLAFSDNFRTIMNFDRGGLKYPTIGALNLVVYNYIVVQKLISDNEKKFLQIANQRNVAIEESYNALINNNMEIMGCEKHSSNKVMTMILRASTNTLLKNYCNEKNDKLAKLKNESKNKKEKKPKEMQNKSAQDMNENFVGKNITQDENNSCKDKKEVKKAKNVDPIKRKQNKFK